MKKHLLNKVVLLAGVCILAAGAQAQITFQLGDSLTISDNTAVDVSGQPVDNSPKLWDTGYVNNGLGGAPFQGCYAGAFDVNIDDTTSGKTGTLLTFCTDIGQDWDNNPTAYTVKNFSTSSGVSPTWPNSPLGIQNAAWIYNQVFVPAETAGTLTANQAAGIQLAIWAALYDTLASGSLQNGLSTVVSSGNFQEIDFASTTVSDANADLVALQTAINNNTFTTYTEYWLDPTGANSQGLIAPMPVPEPTTLIAGALLLLPFGASTLQILRRNRSA